MNMNSKPDSEIINTLKEASDGLYCLSEADYPFEAFLWEDQTKEPLTVERLVQQVGHPQDTPVEVIELVQFFEGSTEEQDWYGPEEKEMVAKYQNLVKTLEDNLQDIKVYRVGEVKIDVYIIGKTGSSALAGLSTKVLET